MKLLKDQFQKNQTWLHQKLKKLYKTKVGGTEEVPLQINGNTYRIDVLDRQKTTAYEIHRLNFGMRFSEKIRELIQLTKMKIVIIHPVVLKQKITRMKQGDFLSVSHINKFGDIYSFFEKLVYFKTEFVPTRMEFEVLFIKEHVVKECVGYWRSGRRKYQIVQRDLITIQETKQFRKRADFVNLLPIGLPPVFTNQELAEKLSIQGGIRRKNRIPGCLTYSLCRLGILRRVGKRGRAHEFTIRYLN
ncbi:MAG: hypothetical protein ACFE8U_07550 [Candidatus Hermodarchaeota archaeon]